MYLSRKASNDAPMLGPFIEVALTHVRYRIGQNKPNSGLVIDDPGFFFDI
jgi:hypothetical protein